MQIKSYIPAFTSLRGIAALLILICHFSEAAYFPILKDLGFPIRSAIWVDFFFILSGFVIALNYGKFFEAKFDGKQYSIFIGKRLLRIYPVHIITLGAMILVELYRINTYNDMGATLLIPAFGDSGTRSLPAIFPNLFLVHSWGLYKNLTWNRPSWSISCEFLYYLLFPALVFVLYKTRKLLTAIVVLQIAYCGIIALDQTGTDMNVTVIRCLTAFCLGMMLYRLHVENEVLPKALRGSALIIGILFLCVFYYQIFGLEYYCVPLFSALIFLISYNRGMAEKLLCNPVCQFFGRISYSLYLWHFVVLNFLDISVYHWLYRGTGSLPSLQNGLMFIGFFAATIVISTISYYLLEVRLPKLLKRK